MKHLLARLIEVYQKTISPDHSDWGKSRHPHGFCQYYPSCSEYGKQAILGKGVFKGIALLVWRVVRCNPWSAGGVDLV